MSRRTATAGVAGLFAAGILLMSPSPHPLHAQAGKATAPSDSARSADLVAAALELEGAGRNREAVVAWRAVLASGAVTPGTLGLERVFSMLGQEDSLLLALDTLLPLYPSEVALRSAQLRALATTGRNDQAAEAFAEWSALAPREVAPYREYARVLLFNNRAAAADTVLRAAEAALGHTRALAIEVAQMRAALGLWRGAAIAWREAMQDEPYYESSAVFSLSPTPLEHRDSVRAELGVAGAPLGASQALAYLEVNWGSPRSGWHVLSALAPSDTVVTIWRDFADEVERARAWATARDALAAIHAARPDASTALRAARAALSSNDADAALTFARDAAQRLDDARALAEAMPLELESLARLGRAKEAERVLERATRVIGPEGARGFARLIAWAWIRAGDVDKARAALKDAPIAAEDAVSGWLALFDGDLAHARRALRHAESLGQDAVSALALLNRTREDTSVAIGAAFLALAQADSAEAARRFEAAAAELPDAAPLLLATAARLETARGEGRRAVALWRRVADEHPESPEAAEAYLEWARALTRDGDADGARQRLEHLILTYPTSALVPQARRELDALRMGAVSTPARTAH